MKFTYLQLIKLNHGLNAISKLALPVQFSFRLARLAKTMADELNAAEKQRLVLVEKHGAKNDKGVFEVTPENEEAFGKEYQSLLEESVDVDFAPIPLADVAHVNIPVGDMMLVADLFISPQSKPAPAPKKQKNPR